MLKQHLQGWKDQNYIAVSIVVLSVIADQITKNMAENMLSLYEAVRVMPLFNLTLAYNEGAAFSFLSEAGGWQRWFFVILSSLVSVGLVFMIGRCHDYEKITRISLALVLGGAIGNLIDRALYGKVIDFLDFYYGASHFPTFNIADCCITLGAIGLLYLTFNEEKPPRGLNK